VATVAARRWAPFSVLVYALVLDYYYMTNRALYTRIFSHLKHLVSVYSNILRNTHMGINSLLYWDATIHPLVKEELP
jgi:hypothetical protein